MNHYEPVEKLRLQLITVINIQLALLSVWVNEYLSGHTDYSISIIAVTQPRGRGREGAWSYCVEQSFEWVSRVVVRVSCGIYEPLRMLTTEKKAFLLYRLFRRLLFEFFIVCLVVVVACCMFLIWWEGEREREREEREASTLFQVEFRFSAAAVHTFFISISVSSEQNHS